jgi:hypothetical protein
MAIVASGQITLTDVNDSKQLQLYISSTQSKTQIYNPNNGSYNPDWAAGSAVNGPVLTPQLFIAGTAADLITTDLAHVNSIKWYDNNGEIKSGHPNFTSYTLTGSGEKFTSLKIIGNLLSSANSLNVTCEVTYLDSDTGFLVTTKADIEFTKVSSGVAGVHAITTLVTNEAHTVPTDANGANGVYTNSGTKIYVYEGASELLYDGVGTSNGTWKVVATATGITAGAISDSGAYATVADASNMTTETAIISYAITGKTSLGTAINITKVQTFSKARSGGGYWLTTSADVIQKSVSPTGTVTLVPTQITVTGFSQMGTTAPSSTPIFKFVTDTSTDGTTFTNNVASPTGTVANTSFNTNFANLKAVRFRMYRSQDTPTTANFIDEQIVMVVNDGSNALYGMLKTPDGNVIKNASGSLTAQMSVYSGITDVTSSVSNFRWYLQDPSATTASGGDTDGGNGWRLETKPADPTVAATLTNPTAASTLTAATYYVRYTWATATGETVACTTEASKTITAGQVLTVTVPAFPAGVKQARVYVGTTTGTANLKYQGAINASAGSLTINAPITTTSSIAPAAYTGGDASVTVPAVAIVGVESLKCIASLNGGKYEDVCTLIDVSDPIQVVVTGVNVFKNGTGTVSLTAKLYQAGEEIDISGTTEGYTYTWTLWDAAGNKKGSWNTTGSKIGKTITVDSADVDVRGNILCEVSK